VLNAKFLSSRLHDALRLRITLDLAGERAHRLLGAFPTLSVAVGVTRLLQLAPAFDVALGPHRHHDRLVAGRSSLARPESHRQGRSLSRNRGEIHDRNGLLWAQQRLVARSLERRRPLALGCREPAPSRCRNDEDQARTRLGNGPNNLAILRHMALNLMQKDKAKGSLRGKFKRAGWDEAYLSSLLAQC